MDIESIIKKSLQEKLAKEDTLTGKIAESKKGVEKGIKEISDILDKVKEYLPDLKYEFSAKDTICSACDITFSKVHIPLRVWGKYGRDGKTLNGFAPFGNAKEYVIHYQSRPYCGTNIEDVMEMVIKELVNKSKKITLS
jgi:hypothetical protein